MSVDPAPLSELARELIATCARHMHPDDAGDDPAALAVHAEVAELPHPDMFVQMMASFVLSAEMKARRRLPDEHFRDRSDLRAANLLDGNGARLLVFSMFDVLDLLANPNRPDAALREGLRVLTEAYGAAATVSLAYVYLTFALDVADFEAVALTDVLADWFLDESLDLNRE